MAKLPASILKQQTAKAIDRASTINSITDATNDGIIMKAHRETGLYYAFYKDIVKSFIIEGYNEDTAEKHIKTWYDYDMITIMFMEGQKLIGFSKVI